MPSSSIALLPAQHARQDEPRAMSFQVLDQTVHISCDDDATADVVRANFAALPRACDTAWSDLDYTLVRAPDGEGYLLQRDGHAPVPAADLCELLFHLEKDLIIGLQWRRPELLYLHAAALECEGQAWLLAGDSGAGKSTTAWGLLHHGFRYLSDELSPVDLETMAVHAYPHALCFKRPPPASYPFPARRAIDLDRTLHLPVAALPADLAGAPCPIGGLIFVQHDPALREPVLRRLHAAEAGARAYVTTLNALAHSRHGMDAIVGLAKSIPCWSLASADLGATCALVQDLACSRLPA